MADVFGSNRFRNSEKNYLYRESGSGLSFLAFVLKRMVSIKHFGKEVSRISNAGNKDIRFETYRHSAIK